ncbi:MAG: ABC transporter permease [Clostridia bacterium]|nr:ABC transporter permease [Clostridia bacterium]
MVDILLSGTTQGLIWAILALGVYVSYRVLDIADLTCEGCITLGASVTALLLWKEVNPWLAVLIAFLAGCIAGGITGVLHTKMKIPPILAGILTMISLYSINIHIMSIATEKQGTANLSLLRIDNLYTDFSSSKLGELLNMGKTNAALLIGVIFCVGIIAILYWFFGTELGSSIRATGNNEKMCRAQGIDTDLTKIIGLALSNGLIAVSGALLSQYQGYSDVNMGVGSIVIGLASIIIGEAIFARTKRFAIMLIGIVVGSVIYRLVVSLVIFSGMPSTDLKVMTAVVVIVALCLTSFASKVRAKSAKGGKGNV